MTGAVVDQRDRLLTRLVTFQKVQARIDAEVQDTLAELAALPLPACLDRHDKQYVVDEVAAVLRLPSRTAGAWPRRRTSSLATRPLSLHCRAVS